MQIDIFDYFTIEMFKSDFKIQKGLRRPLQQNEKPIRNYHFGFFFDAHIEQACV